MKNYLSLVLNGYLCNSDYLTEYFYREQKNAEKEFIGANEFFGKCFKVIEAFKEDLDKQMYKRKHELYMMLSMGKQKKDKELIEYCETELKEISRDNFTVTLHYFTNGQFPGHLWHKQILFIEDNLRLAESKIALEKAKGIILDKIDKKQKTEQPEQTENSDPGKFNDYTHRLFEYLISEYEAVGKIKFINIWYFLRQDIKQKENILFNFTQDRYKEFVKDKYNIDIRKFAKSKFKYEDDELPLLQNIAKIFHKKQGNI